MRIDYFLWVHEKKIEAKSKMPALIATTSLQFVVMPRVHSPNNTPKNYSTKRKGRKVSNLLSLLQYLSSPTWIAVTTAVFVCVAQAWKKKEERKKHRRSYLKR